MTFVDTNYFLRFLLADIKFQHQIAKNLFRNAAVGKVKLCTSIIVFFELYWVLSSFYKKSKKELIELLGKVLRMKFIKLEGRDLLEAALEIFAETSFDLEDTFNLVYAQELGVTDFKTFDKKLAKRFLSL